MNVRVKLLTFAAATVVWAAGPCEAQPASSQPWLNTSLDPDSRAALVVHAMTREEKLSLVFGYFSSINNEKKYNGPPGSRPGSAGYVPGIARLGIPPQWQTDAGVGVATQGAAPSKRERTALPAGIATTATWNPDLAFKGGQMIGAEARASGFNVMLAGGANLARDPRNGRNFEYGGEDPLLAGTMVGAQIAGIQSNHIISTSKHYALNDLETARFTHDAKIDPAAARMSDLLAFQLAIERGDPGSVMCAYNLVNAVYACENTWLLTDVLRGAFGFKGYVMSDWGAVHSTRKAALAGLDQDSGFPFDDQPYFGDPLRAAVASGQVPESQLDLMAMRIVRSMFAHGLVDNPVTESAPIDFAAHEAVSQADAEQGIVLLKNDRNLLPITANARKIVVIGSYADKGVLSGGGSSQVYPHGGNAVPGLEPTGWPGPVVYFPDSPVAAIRALAPQATVTYVEGTDPASAAAAAKGADIAIVFANSWNTESADAPLGLSGNQDALIAAVAAANPRTAVVLETGNPVLMPWAAKVPAIVEAWFPGSSGGKAIANVLLGRVNPSGHLPISFPRADIQLPRPVRPGTGLPDDAKFVIDYTEGAAVGYKWYERQKLTPLYPFGHGLSYTRFAYGPPRAQANPDGTVTVAFTVRNSGTRQGMDVAQVYAAPTRGGWEAPKRLAGFHKVDLAPGAATDVVVTIDPRLLATFDGSSQQWRIAPGSYRVMVGESSRDIHGSASVSLAGVSLPSDWRPGQPVAVLPAKTGERGR